MKALKSIAAMASDWMLAEESIADSKIPNAWCLPEKGFVGILLTGNND